nr:type II toxin-antitoxin system HicB family antitoxin [Clostridia bacterium]
MKDYEIKIVPGKDASGNIYWTASFPAVDGCIGGGDTPESAVKEAYENLEVYLEYLESIKAQAPSAYEENQYSGG